MDLRQYYKKIHELETKLEDEFPLIVSRESADGGKEGTRTEVARRLAARMVVEGAARLATQEEAKRYRDEVEEKRKAAEQAAAASKLQLTVISAVDLDKLKGRPQPTKG
jgi:hypothetical protein